VLGEKERRWRKATSVESETGDSQLDLLQYRTLRHA